MSTKPHGMTGKRNAAKSPEERVSAARIDVPVGALISQIDAAAAAAGLSRAAWCRRAFERQLESEKVGQD